MSIFIFIRHALVSCFLYCMLVAPLYADASLDVLFVDLKNSIDESEARSVESLIWKKWLESGDSAIDDLMKTAQKKRSSYDFNGALEVLNRIIEIRPEFVAAWNERATVYFRQQCYEKSLEDIAKTLELEPRHFGALAGRAVIRLQQLKPALAQQSMIEALKIHPFLKERNMFPNL